jgi:hypothetical protein
MGYVIMLNGGPVAWKSKLQPTIALSTSDAEFIAANFAACEIMFLRQFMKELGFEQKEPTCLYVDNAAAVYLANEPGLRPRTKHLDVKYMYLVEKTIEGAMQVVHVSGKTNLADIMTKPLGPTKFSQFSSRINTVKGEMKLIPFTE